MTSKDIEKLMKSSVIRILKDGKGIDYHAINQMKGEDLLMCNVLIKEHEVRFYKGVIPDGFMFSSPTKFGIGYHYRNVGVCF